MTIVGTDLTVTIVVRKTFSSTEKEWANFLAMVQDSESHSRETQGEEGHLKAWQEMERKRKRMEGTLSKTRTVDWSKKQLLI